MVLTDAEAIGVALGSGLVGYTLSLWRNRLIPIVTVEGFHQGVDYGVDPHADDRVREWANKSVTINASHRELEDMQEVTAVFEHSNHLLHHLPEIETKILEGLRRVKVSNSNPDIVKALRQVLRDYWTSEFIQSCLIAGGLAIDPPKGNSPILSYMPHPRNGGCFVIDFQRSQIYFGSQFDDKPFRRSKVEPFVHAVSCLDQKSIVTFLEAVSKQVKEEHECCRQLVDQLRPILENHTRWSCSLSLTNLGTRPFIILPGYTKMIVEGPDMKPAELQCELARSEGESKRQSVFLIPPETTVRFEARTERVQHELANGPLLRTAYDEGLANARVELAYKGRNFPMKFTLKTKVQSFGTKKAGHSKSFTSQ